MADAVVFTCNHEFTRSHFTDTVIPELRERLKVLK